MHGQGLLQVRQSHNHDINGAAMAAPCVFLCRCGNSLEQRVAELTADAEGKEGEMQVRVALNATGFDGFQIDSIFVQRITTTACNTQHAGITRALFRPSERQREAATAGDSTAHDACLRSLNHSTSQLRGRYLLSDTSSTWKFCKYASPPDHLFT